MIRPFGRTFLVALVVLLSSVTCGCSYLIAKSGVSSSNSVYVPQTRAEVQDQFGKADETSTCPGGQVVERRWIRQQVDWICQKRPGAGAAGFGSRLGCEALKGAYQGSYGLVDVFVVPVMLYKSERAKLHFAFVYDEKDRVLYRYNLAASAPEQFDEVTRPLRNTLHWQLADGECDSWTPCITAYVQAAWERTSCIQYTIIPQNEEVFKRMLDIGKGVDAGQISYETALTDIVFSETNQVKPEPPPLSSTRDSIPSHIPSFNIIQFHTPDEKVGYNIACEDRNYNWSTCYKRVHEEADERCKAKGYSVVSDTTSNYDTQSGAATKITFIVNCKD